MGPEWFLEAALVCAGILAAAAAVSLLVAQQRSQAARLGAASLLLFVLAFALGRSEGRHHSFRRAGPGRSLSLAGLKPAARPSPPRDSGSDTVMTFLLGDVRLRVARAARYVFSVDGQPFLTLASEPTGLSVSGEPANATSHPAVRIRDSSFGSPMPGVRSTRPDSSTILVEEAGRAIVRIRFAEPQKIEVYGRFFVAEPGETFLVTRANGVQWRGGILPAGATVDLSMQGRGRINFERSGLVQIAR